MTTLFAVVVPEPLAVPAPVVVPVAVASTCSAAGVVVDARSRAERGGDHPVEAEERLGQVEVLIADVRAPHARPSGGRGDLAERGVEGVGDGPLRVCGDLEEPLRQALQMLVGTGVGPVDAMGRDHLGLDELVELGEPHAFGDPADEEPQLFVGAGRRRRDRESERAVHLGWHWGVEHLELTDVPPSGVVVVGLRAGRPAPPMPTASSTTSGPPVCGW